MTTRPPVDPRLIPPPVVALGPDAPADTSAARPPRTVRELVGDLRDLGVQSSDVLLVHCRLRDIGAVERGARGVLAALTEAVGKNGTLVLPAFTELNSDTSLPFQRATHGLSDDELQAYKSKMPPFDPVWTPASPTMGALAEVLRQAPGSVRSSHPQSSFVARGSLADGIVRHHNPVSHFGEQSPLARLFSLPDAKVLMLGAGFSAFTGFHLAEYYQSRIATRMYRCVAPDWLGRPMWASYEDVLLDLADFDRIGADLTEHIPIAQGLVGNAQSRLVPLIPAVAFAADWMARNRTNGAPAVA
ncbi:aminoglycoside N(3)-acetyltransferase [Yinghuangia soli]|uniref:Aminoglycoside N(3)-acetyltransferase n=1 Tax=Yinghuangia soli TaxID=2908204 RepID=A0AA41Q2I6_9ACTN|nr:AAC(3) family N-acetyltransferase [Yinghuangia soli]MCF2528912.1 AAC(3) family N-acetyltransferase [Yinghuangia soli]